MYPEAGFDGVIVGFDHPGDDRANDYLEAQRDARFTVADVIDDGLSWLAATPFRGCRFIMPVVAHPLGAEKPSTETCGWPEIRAVAQVLCELAHGLAPGNR